ncbi:MAG: hypothetical protein ACKPKO_64935, partial [Candidatus Fonsibacter sp.]
ADNMSQQCVSVSTDENAAITLTVFLVIILIKLAGLLYITYVLFKERIKRDPVLCDASTQTTSFGNLPNDELDATVASLLNSPFYPSRWTSPFCSRITTT